MQMRNTARNFIGSRKTFKNYPDLDLYYGQRNCDINKNEIGRKYFPKMSPKYYMLYGMRVLPTDATFWSEKVHKLSGTLDEKTFTIKYGL